MSSGQHTPGPWHACNLGHCSCAIVSCADHPIAKVTRGEWGDTWPSIRLVGETSLDLKAEPFMDSFMYGTVSDETAQANARLIAAAPDLYEALSIICSEFAQQHPLIIAGRVALDKARAARAAGKEDV